MTVARDILQGLACLVMGVGMDPHGGQDGGDLARIQLVVPLLGPVGGEGTRRSVDGFGHVRELLPGVEEVHDLHGPGDQLVGQVPDPGGSVARDDPAEGLMKAAAPGFAAHALGELRLRLIGVAGSSALEGGRVGDGARVAHGGAVVVAALGDPERDQLALAGLGRAIGLLAGPADPRRGAHDQGHGGLEVREQW